VRSIYADWERGDFGRTDWADPAIEFVIADGPLPGRWTGLAGMSEAWREFLGAWEDWRVEVEDYRELDDGRVLVLTHYSGRGKVSGLELSRMQSGGANLFHIRDGKVTKRVLYLNGERALADLGLAAEGHSS
jgi:hypothetical protein